MPTRRQTLWGLGGAAVATVGGLSLLSNLRSHAGPSASAVQSSFKLPEILKGTRKGAETVYDLQLQTGTSNFLEGLKRPKRGTLNISKAREILNFKPEYDLEKGVQEYLDFMEENCLSYFEKYKK